MTDLHPTIAAVTDRITRRSAPRRAAYLDLMQRQREATSAGKLGTDIGMIGRESKGQQFIDDLRLRAIRRSVTSRPLGCMYRTPG